MNITIEQLYNKSEYFSKVEKLLNEQMDWQLCPSHLGDEIVLVGGRKKVIEGDTNKVRMWMALQYEALIIQLETKSGKRMAAKKFKTLHN